MKKVFSLENLECANCAAKMEAAISRLDGVERASIHYMAAKLTVAAPDHLFQPIMEQAQRIVRKIEPACRIVV